MNYLVDILVVWRNALHTSPTRYGEASFLAEPRKGLDLPGVPTDMN
jgi:hypothetical protein